MDINLFSTILSLKNMELIEAARKTIKEAIGRLLTFFGIRCVMGSRFSPPKSNDSWKYASFRKLRILPLPYIRQRVASLYKIINFLNVSVERLPTSSSPATASVSLK